MPWEIIRAVLWYIVSIVVIIGAAYWVTRKIATHGVGGLSARGAGVKIEPLAQMNVGKNERLLLAAVGKRYFLLGITAGGINTLAEFSEEEANGWKANADQPLPPKGMNFAETMSTILKKKGQR